MGIKQAIRGILLAVSAAGLTVGAARQAQAYPIDCAILLCLAGGWPASAECSAARIEFIRRVTPWPVEPPLQIWRCPMKASFGPFIARPEAEFRSRLYEVALRNPPTFDAIPDLQTAPEKIAAKIIRASQADIDISGREFDFVRSIRVWHIEHYRHAARGREGDCEESQSIEVGTYGRQGDFRWAPSGSEAVPSWIGMRRSCEPASSFRGVGVEWRDHQGNHGHEVVRY